MHLRTLTGVCLLWLAGCGISADAPLLMTCDVRANASAEAHGQCQEWRGDKADKTNAEVEFSSVCTGTLSGALLMDGCPGGAVGVCTKRPSVAERVVLLYYYAPDFAAASASAHCATQSGTFSAK